MRGLPPSKRLLFLHYLIFTLYSLVLELSLKNLEILRVSHEISVDMDNDRGYECLSLDEDMRAVQAEKEGVATLYQHGSEGFGRAILLLK